MTLTDIEKAAKLMGYDYLRQVNKNWDHLLGETHVVLKSGDPSNEETFNPYTNKADLVDVECALGIDVIWCHVDNQANGLIHAKCDELSHEEWYSDHSHNKFTARAHAVMAVVEQIYDRREG